MAAQRSTRSTNSNPAALQQPLASVENLPPPPTPTTPQAGAAQIRLPIDEPENATVLQGESESSCDICNQHAFTSRC